MSFGLDVSQFIAGGLKKSPTFRPFMRQFIPSALVAKWARQHQIIGIIRAATRYRYNMIDMILLAQFLLAPVAGTFLPLILLANVLRAIRTATSTAVMPIPIVQRSNAFAVSFHIIPLFLGVGTVVFSALAPVLFRMAFAICLFACSNSVMVLQFLLAMIGSKFFKMGFSIDSKAIFTFRGQFILTISLMRVKILLGSGFLLLAPRAPFISLRSRAVSPGIGFRFSRWLFAAFSRLTQFAVACQTSFLASICIEVVKGRGKIVIAFRTMLQWYTIVHERSSPFFHHALGCFQHRESDTFLVESL